MQKSFEQEFTALFDNISYGHNKGSLFQDFVEIMALTLHQAPYHNELLRKDKDYEWIESQYMTLIGKYKRDVVDMFPKLFSITQMALAEQAQDFLGNIYMKLELNNRRGGEFFTPYHISKMIAKMVLSDIDSSIREKGFFTLCEPACGAGGMLIAAADVIMEEGFHPGQSMWFSATDINKMCFNMTYVQATILGLSGMVVHGDTISMEVFEARETPVAKIFPKYSHTSEEKKEVAEMTLRQAQSYHENKKGQLQLF